MNLVFMGTPDFAKESLRALVEEGYNIKLVITTPDKPKGRGMKFQYSPVKEYALEQGLEVEQPLKIKKNAELFQKLRDLSPDLICVVAYGKIIPNEILGIPVKGCVNVHGSLLPKYRGAAPIQWAVLNGDKITGITTMYINEKMDEGDILLKEEVEIGEEENVGELWNKLSKVGAQLLIKTLKEIEKGTIIPIPQTSKGLGKPTYAPMLEKSMAEIDWKNKSAIEIKNQVRGLNPIMGAYTFISGKKLKFWKVQVLESDKFIEEYKIENFIDKQNGDIILTDNKIGLFIKANDGVISVLEIQAENSKRMSILEYLRGNNK